MTPLKGCTVSAIIDSYGGSTPPHNFTVGLSVQGFVPPSRLQAGRGPFGSYSNRDEFFHSSKIITIR